MADKAWKAAERRVAKYVSGERVPITGRQRGDAPDIEHRWLSIELKYRKNLPAWFKDAMNQAELSARTRQLPVVIMIEKGQPVGEAFIMCKLKDFKDHWL